MLRITIAETLTEQKWTLEGRLVQPWISELKSNWTRTEIARRRRKCVVDLTGVTFIDKSGEKALSRVVQRRRGTDRDRYVTPGTSCRTSREKSRIVSLWKGNAS